MLGMIKLMLQRLGFKLEDSLRPKFEGDPGHVFATHENGFAVKVTYQHHLGCEKTKSKKTYTIIPHFVVEGEKMFRWFPSGRNSPFVHTNETHKKVAEVNTYDECIEILKQIAGGDFTRAGVLDTEFDTADLY